LQRDMAIRNLKAEFCLPNNPPKLIPVPGVFRSKINERENGASNVSGKKATGTLMYVGTLYVDDFVPFTPLHPGPVLVDWEARLFSELRKLGYRVVVKPHPESKNSISAAALDRLGVRVANERFEQVYMNADALLFGQTNSSTFFGALGTDSSIVLANEALNPWQPEAERYAAERCALADTCWGPGNRLETDWSKLDAWIADATTKRSQNFYKNFFLQ